MLFFLAEYNFPFHGSSSKIGDPHNGLFLGALKLLGKHNSSKSWSTPRRESLSYAASLLNLGFSKWIYSNFGNLVKSKILEEENSASYIL